MAEKVEIDVVAKTDKAVKAINDLNLALGKVATAGDKQRKGFKALDKVSGGYATKVKDLAGAVKDGIGGFKGLIKTVKGFRTALLTTGIGALVVALGLVVAYWDDIKNAVNGVSKAQKESLDLQKEAVLESEKQAEITRSMENTLKLQGKTEKEIRDLKKQQLGETIKNLEAQLLTQREMKKSQVEAAERNKSIAKGIIAFLSAPILILTGLVDGITNSLAAVGVLEEGTSLTEDYLESTSSFLFDPEEVAAEGDAVIDETEKKLRELKNKRDGIILQDNKDEKDRIKKENEEKLKLEEDYQKRLADLKNRIREAEANTEEEARALELQKIEEHNKKLMAEALANGLLSQELINSLNETLQAKKDEFALKDREKAQAKKIEELELDREFDTLTFAQNNKRI
jgi:DNA repair exonuclease SbcCD ATPase subunit